ncbi:hypothetical protein ACJRO7_025703 [Eucalyptus globulus]|uniref:Disease resistance R13L4/SHOC-2-like LRR domain-containing protein n=1 Tax=Eucalyptus globulus TaxID=34317 RepID=A0ABD3KEN0_EUCGL
MPDIALNVVQRKLVADKIVALRLTGDSKGRNFTSEEFSKLPNLRFLELEGGNLVGDFKNLLSKLTWFSWSHFPSKLKAKNLCLEKLVVLELSRGDLGDWAKWEQCMVSNNLKVIHINDSKNLHRTPDFSKCENLKRFICQDCSTTPMVDSSLFKLEHLKHLEIKGKFMLEGNECNLFVVPFASGSLRSLSTLYIQCMNVEGIHHSFGEMMHLKYLSFSNCLLRKVPDSIGKLKSLVELDLYMTEITELPHCIGDLKKLTKLSLHGTLIEKLPNSIGGLESLIKLDLTNLDITELPTCIGNLKKLECLYLHGSKIKELPYTIGMLENLKELDASSCNNLEGEIPKEIGALSFLRMLNLSYSWIRRLPTSMNRLSHLQELNLNQCHKLEQISELPMSLKDLDFPSHLLWTAANLSHLTNLDSLCIRDLHISRGTPQLSEFGDGAPNIEWIKGLSKLEYLSFLVKDVTFSLNDLTTLSRLRCLEMTWIDHRSWIALPSGLSALRLYDLRSPEVKLDDVFGQQLERLDWLYVGGSELLERLSGLSSLKGLESLSVESCPRLLEIQDSTVAACIKQEYEMLRPHLDTTKEMCIFNQKLALELAIQASSEDSYSSSRV